MKRLASLLVLLIVLAFMAQTTVVSFFPELKAYLMATSGVAEEVVEEDESGEEDKAVVKNGYSPLMGWSSADYQERVIGMPYKIFREIIAPPPQV